MTVPRLTAEVRAFLEERRFGVLATINPDGTPQLTTMWFELQGNEIMMNTAAGRVKSANLQRDPRVALCVEEGYRYVTLAGVVHLVDDQAIAQADICRLAERYEGPEEADRMTRSQFSKQQRITLRLAIERVSAHL